MRGLYFILLWLCCSNWLQAAGDIPSKPARYVNDYASVIADASENRLNSQLEQFERDTSSQVVVAVFQQLPTGANLENHCLATFNAWGIGQASKDNGVLLAVFVNDRRLRIQVGTGLEKALSDSLCQQIIDQEITPKFKQADLTGGVEAGVQAILRAMRGEYSGSGVTVHQSSPPATVTYYDSSSRSSDSPFGGFGVVIFVIFFVVAMFRGNVEGTDYSSRGCRHHRSSWGRSSSSRSWSSSSRSSGGGGFSGGGGSSRGGGASGGW